MKNHPEAVIKALYAGDVKLLDQYVTSININEVDSDGHSLLSLAATAMYLSMPMVRFLVKRGADVNVRLPQERWSLLHFAVHTMRKDLAGFLLEAGCDPNAVDGLGNTPLNRVLLIPNPKSGLIGLLLEYGADPIKTQEGTGESAIELATRTGQLDLLPSK